MISESIRTAPDRASRNRTLTIDGSDFDNYGTKLLQISAPQKIASFINRTIFGDSYKILPFLPKHSIDLVVIDPPYNLTKEYNGSTFKRRRADEYEDWLHSWLSLIAPLLKPSASIYVCSEWRSSSSVQAALEKYFVIQNRITWEREKGRGALRNWKNCSEDIWFCTVSSDYYFDVDAVKQKRRVIAPYKDQNGQPKDWSIEDDVGFRITHPSNIWTDITIPFWSMPENTDHPTQKPEKLIAKLILASSRPNEVVLDPFLGSGTTSVVAKKLGRKYIGIEQEKEYCLLAEKRLALAEKETSIQGYSDGLFWERNTLALQLNGRSKQKTPPSNQANLFGEDFEKQTIPHKKISRSSEKSKTAFER